jgi:hypothetical protein
MQFVMRDSARARQRVEDPEWAISQGQQDPEIAENAVLNTPEPEKTLHEKMVATWDSLSDNASSDIGEQGEEVKDAMTEQHNLTEDDKPSWLIGTISKTVQKCMERVRQKQMTLDELTS